MKSQVTCHTFTLKWEVELEILMLEGMGFVRIGLVDIWSHCCKTKEWCSDQREWAAGVGTNMSKEEHAILSSLVLDLSMGPCILVWGLSVLLFKCWLYNWACLVHMPIWGFSINNLTFLEDWHSTSSWRSRLSHNMPFCTMMFPSNWTILSRVRKEVKMNILTSPYHSLQLTRRMFLEMLRKWSGLWISLLPRKPKGDQCNN